MSTTQTLNVLCLSTDLTLKQALSQSLRSFGQQISLEFCDPDNVSGSIETADAVLAGSFPPEINARARKLRWLQLWSAGVDGKLYPELFSRDVVVTTGSGIHAASASEHVLSLMLAFARGLPGAFEAQKARDWSRRDELSKTIFELEGKTIGIVGAGVIGQAIGARCQAFGMRTVGTRRDTTRPTPGIDILLSHLQYHDLILESDFIVLALPLTPGTRMMFGEDEIEIVRKGTYFFNIGRGGLVDEAWLLRALQNKWLAGAGLDVFVDEPLPESSPFWTLPNCIVTPHVGGVTPAYWTRYARLVARQAALMLSDQPLENRVDKNLGY